MPEINCGRWHHEWLLERFPDSTPHRYDLQCQRPSGHSGACKWAPVEEDTPTQWETPTEWNSPRDKGIDTS